MKKYNYEHMYPDEFLNAVQELPIFYLPLGLLEWHANHLPLGLDGLKAGGLCSLIASSMGGGIVMPINYFSRPGFSTYVGTLTYSDGCLDILYNEIFNQLKKVGAKLIVLFTGHYGTCQTDFIRRIADTYNKENSVPKVLAIAEYEDVLVDGVAPCDHAGIFETSIMEFLYPDSVDKYKLLFHPSFMKIYNNAPNNYYNESSEWTFSNDVTKYNKELGEKCVAAIVAKAVEKIKLAYLKGVI